MCLCGHLTMLSHPNSRPLILIALGFSKSFIEVQIFILEGKKSHSNTINTHQTCTTVSGMWFMTQ